MNTQPQPPVQPTITAIRKQLALQRQIDKIEMDREASRIWVGIDEHGQDLPRR